MSKELFPRGRNLLFLSALTLLLANAFVHTGLSAARPATPSAASQVEPATAQATAASAGDSRQLLVSARSVAIIARPGEVAQTGRLMWDPDPGKARNKLEKAVRAWGRLTIVDDPVAADLVFLIVEGNRSGLVKQGELYEVLLVFPGGSPESGLDKPLWQQEGKEGFGGRPADKLLQQFRKYVEELENSLPPAAPSAGTANNVAQPQPEAQPAKVKMAPAPPPQPVVSQQLETQAVSPPEGKPLPEVHVSSTLETWMASPYLPDEKMPMPIEELLAAKSIAVIAFGPESPKGAKGFFGRMLTGKSSLSREASASSAKEDALKQIQEWNRYVIVEDPAAADLVVVLREWNDPGMFRGPYVGAKIALIKGGPDALENPEVLWTDVDRRSKGYATKVLVGEIGRALKKASKAAEKR